MAFPFIKAMKKIIKIKENYVFRRSYRRGKSLVSPYFVIYAMPNRRNVPRLGITASKKLGGAVKRNRAKRVITAAFRDCAPYIKPNYDFVIVARTRILNIKSTAAAESMLKLFREAGILKTDEKTVNRAD